MNAHTRTFKPSIPLPRNLPEATRKKVSEAIDRLMVAQDALIAFLDEADGDSDLEDGADDEPSLGSQESRNGGTTWSCAGDGDDREDDGDDLEPDVDDEPRSHPETWTMP